MKNRYRVIRGVDGFYHSRVKRWWFPVWSSIFGHFSGFHGVDSLCKARDQIERYRNPRVYYQE